MSKKLTYEELELRIEELERKAFERKLSEEASHVSTGFLDTLISSLSDGVIVYDDKFRYKLWNKFMEKLTGMRAENVLGEIAFDIFPHLREEGVDKLLERALAGETVQSGDTPYHVPDTGKTGEPVVSEAKILRKNGVKVDTEFSNTRIKISGIPLMHTVARNITYRKQAEKALKQAHDELERRVEERTRELELKTKSLEEFNTAMKVLLKKREEDKIEIEENVMTNVKELIAPYFEKMKKTKLDDHQKAFVNILESNLNEIVSPFTRKLSLKYLSLTPKEITIVNMIKIGYPSKKIAKIMKISPRTVDTHRKNIRSKIGLGKKRANLRSHLLAYEQ